ncbi:hypothetical protein PH562_18770 [Rhizobium sp. CNPSo 4062]|uniref:hypothetical protein n=1 Tax=Rhizobium sp. CNPSo 4062 TaxID=3021410 RepID=UPI00254E10D3|nr:hypothetical protein [Rhizobium sp. CNPSo 4062]MDK4704303.1 hypothetical protein [Rhizobium sp. CNPSo 4062]
MSANQKRNWTIYFTEDGEFFAAFVHGHLDLQSLDTGAIAREINEIIIHDWGFTEGLEHFDASAAEIENFWIYDAHKAGDTDNDEYCWWMCGADQPGAIAVAGLRGPR